MAGLGGLWQTVIFGFGGVDLTGEKLSMDPKLPPQWRSLSFRVCWRGRVVAIRIAGKNVQARLVEGKAMELRIAGATHKLMAGAPMRAGVGDPGGNPAEARGGTIGEAARIPIINDD
jgi:trehalose/maltose hydrolase-like predicted phosphorylase